MVELASNNAAKTERPTRCVPPYGMQTSHRAEERRPAYEAFRAGSRLNRISITAPTEIAESAMLNAGNAHSRQ